MSPYEDGCIYCGGPLGDSCPCEGKSRSSNSPAGSITTPTVRRVGGKTLLVVGDTEQVITTEQALELAESLKSAAFMAGDY